MSLGKVSELEQALHSFCLTTRTLRWSTSNFLPLRQTTSMNPRWNFSGVFFFFVSVPPGSTRHLWTLESLHHPGSASRATFVFASVQYSHHPIATISISIAPICTAAPVRMSWPNLSVALTLQCCVLDLARDKLHSSALVTTHEQACDFVMPGAFTTMATTSQVDGGESVANMVLLNRIGRSRSERNL